MSELKPIETVYNGYRFRSRLEARWAVFFDSLGFKWQYEVEGFELPSGAKYLPDFYFPNSGIFGEVKPDKNIPFEELSKVCEFACHSVHGLLLIVGIPGEQTMYFLDSLSCGGGFDRYAARWQGCGLSRDEAPSAFLEWVQNGGWEVAPWLPPEGGSWGITYMRLSEEAGLKLNRAYDSARQARFEFGESGARKEGT